MFDPVRSHATRPLHTLLLLFSGALLLALVLINSAARGSHPTPGLIQRYIAPSDTDSVAVDPDDALLLQGPPPSAPTPADVLATIADTTQADSLLSDSTLADTLAADTTWRARYYLRTRRDRPAASLFPRQRSPFSTELGPYWQHRLTQDSTGAFVAREQVGDEDVRVPVRVDADTYAEERMRVGVRRNWESLIAQQAQLREQQRQRGAGLGVNIAVPGGRQTAFSTIFGEPTVDLRVTGQADIRAGFDYRKSDQQALLTGNASQVDPDFKQDLRLGVTGRIGDKMRVDVNWDTNRDFDYQNQLKLQYTGYDDEILQNVEAGNVFLNTPSTLIRGGQSLFGIKSEFKVGGVRLTTVASTQKGQSSSLSLDGGAEATEFEKRPTQYDRRKHFFLGYYFRNRWEDAHLTNLENITLFDGFNRVAEVEVWKLVNNTGTEGNENERQVIAMVDLGEPPELLEQADSFTLPRLPSNTIDQYSDADIDQILVPNAGDFKNFLEGGSLPVPLTGSDYQQSSFRKLQRGVDYDLDERLGYITLRQTLNESEALAVAYRIETDAGIFTVGDLNLTGGGNNSQTSDRLVLKLLRPTNLPQPTENFNPAAWYLELRNIYQLSSSLKPTDLEVRIEYQPPGQRSTEKVADISGQQTLLQALGLDLANEQGAPSPDDQIDQFFIDFSNGFLIFPYLEPFGSRIRELVGDNQERIDQYVYDEVYTQKVSNAELVKELDVYRITGSFKGAVADFYDLRAYSGLVPGSVRVTSGGTPLVEGTDFVVNYEGGTLTITNPSYLTSGRDIEIEYEQNALFQLQTKTLLGARLDYELDERLGMGATVMRLSQQSASDKFRLGEEPIANTIWGVDGKLDLEPRWLTRVVDALPLLQTRAPSSLSITGEFAQLRPGHTQTTAFDRARDNLRDAGRDFSSDELGGISYIDDFEGFENTYTLMQPGAWRLSAPPAFLPVVDGDPTTNGADRDSLRTNWRGTMAWYSLNQGSIETLDQQGVNFTYDPLLRPDEVFRNRPPDEQVRTLQTLDLYYTPHERGPYNYNTRLDDFLASPEQSWGGIIQRLPENYSDFSLQNIEFLEFVFQVVDDDIDPDAKLYVDLGVISEEIIPDNALNQEDGLAFGEQTPLNQTVDWARLSTTNRNDIINIDEDSRRTEDVGLDGFASYPNNEFDPTVTEQNHFQAYLNALQNQNRAQLTAEQQRFLDREIAKAQADPSGDDFHFFGDNEYFSNGSFYPNGTTVQDRHTRYFPGMELNTIEAQSRLGSANDRRGNSRTPDTEDLNLNISIDSNNRYFEYALSLHPDSLQDDARPENINDFVVEQISQTDDGAWYLGRIPVQQFSQQIGGVEDFSQIESIRLWTMGHSKPVTLRFASLELVGSQWRASQDVAEEDLGLSPGPDPIDPDDDEPPMVPDDVRLSVSSINNFESTIYRVPPGAIVSQIRSVTSGEARSAREQALVLRAENLRPGQQRAVFRTYQGLDLLKYSNLRMFTHFDGVLGDGRKLEELASLEEARSKARLFIRLGANEVTDYYEYEQPLTPSSPLSGNPDSLWQVFVQPAGASNPIDLGSMNIELGTFNQLKFFRDENLGELPPDVVLWSNDPIAASSGLDSLVQTFAPPGSRVGIKGTPSLGRVNAIVIGIRNPDGSESILEDVTLWVNELRATGYDERKGYAALLNADLALADVARIKANFRTQSDGFGSLASTLDDRDQRDTQDWSVNTQFSLHKFIPERFGWQIPISFEVKSSTTTPRFDPNRGDVRVEELLTAIDASDLEQSEKEIRKDEIVEASQTHTTTRSFTGRVQKRGSRSRLLRNTVDGVSFNYSYSEASGRTPRLHTNDSWRWTSTLGYRLAVRRPRTVRPFGFLGDVPVVGVLGGLRFNYLPQSLNFTASANRRYSISQERVDPTRQGNSGLPELVEFDLRDTQAFGHNRRFTIQYEPFNFLNLSFDTNTDQSLDALGVDTLFTVIRVDSLGVEDILWLEDPSRDLDDAFSDGLINEDAGEQGFQVERLNVLSTGSVASDLFSGDTSPRTERYESRLNTTFRPNLENIGALDWMTLQDVSYTAIFSWRNGALGNNTGATAGTSVDLRTGITFRPVEFWQKFGFYERMETKQREEESAKQQARQARQQERADRKRQRAEEREQRRQQEANQASEEEALQRNTDDEALEPAPDNQPDETPSEDPTEEAPAETDGEAEEETEGEDTEAEEESGPSFPIPLPNPVKIARQTFLAFTGIRDFSITYASTRSIDATSVGRLNDQNEAVVNYSLFDALFQNEGPSLGYRFGFNQDIDNRIITENVQVKDLLTNGHRFQARTAINPSRALRVSLNWTLDFNNREDVTFRNEDLETIRTATSNGDNRASVWAFGASYEQLFEEQFRTFERLPTGSSEAGDEVVLTDETLTEDFRQAYLRGFGPIDGKGLIPFPMPGWQITYSGIANWPLFRTIAQSASLRHGYSADYSNSFRSNLEAGQEDAFVLGGQSVAYVLPDNSIDAIRLNERYAPLLGLDLSFRGNIQASVAVNKGNTYSLSTTTAQIREAKTNEVTLSTSYQLNGLTLPFFGGKRLNNQIGLNLTASLASNDERTLLLRNALDAAASNDPNVIDETPGNADVPTELARSDNNQDVTTSTSRLLLSPKISYRFSNRVSADFFIRYEKFNGDSRLPSNTSVNGGFNVRVSISN